MHRAWRGEVKPATVGELRRAITEFAEQAGIHGETLDDIRACVSEAVTNAVLHAYRDGRAPVDIGMTADLQPEELVVTVTDQGVGFLPRNDSPGLGLGIPTIVGLASSMSLSTPQGGGTELRMSFALHGLG